MTSLQVTKAQRVLSKLTDHNCRMNLRKSSLLLAAGRLLLSSVAKQIEGEKKNFTSSSYDMRKPSR